MQSGTTGFILLVETPLAEAEAIAERVREALAGHVFQAGNGQKLHVTASLGIARHSGHPDQEYLVRQADQALYGAKQNGRNRVEIAD